MHSKQNFGLMQVEILINLSENMRNQEDKCDTLFITLRKIIQAIDLHSKQLVHQYGLTGPQMVVLKVICQSGEALVNSKQLAQNVSLSQATICSILDRLVEKGYIQREKSQVDKRKTYIRATEKATVIFAQNPALLQEDFVKQFDALKDWEQDFMLASLERLADMLHTKSMDAISATATPDLFTLDS